MQGIGQGMSRAASDMSAMQLWKKTIELNRLKNEQAPGALEQAGKVAKLENEIRVGKVECATCASRRYVDKSDDPSVSFQTPQNVSPSQSYGAVMGHEMEHVRNESARADRQNREVVHSSVTVQHAICPECGRVYVAGGETTTVTRSADSKQDKPDGADEADKAGSAGKDGRKLNLLA